jgi:hypothetical protein
MLRQMVSLAKRRVALVTFERALFEMPMDGKRQRTENSTELERCAEWTWFTDETRAVPLRQLLNIHRALMLLQPAAVLERSITRLTFERTLAKVDFDNMAVPILLENKFRVTFVTGEGPVSVYSAAAPCTASPD